MNLFWFGLLLGLGASVPLGPINLEITRRNLNWGTSSGIWMGFGACSADITYLIVLSLGVLTFFKQPLILNSIGLVGSLILAWFGVMSLRQKTTIMEGKTPIIKKPKKSLFQNSLEGYLLTLINPYTILFWASVNTQLVLITTKNTYAIYWAGIGVVVAVVSWVLLLNWILHRTKHRLSSKAMDYLNKAGGLILLFFAAYGLKNSLVYLLAL